MVKVEPTLRESSGASDNTMNRILDAAEQLFAEKGVAATSVRNITDKAEVNVAAVNYHFDTKENLIRKVIERRAFKLDDGRSAALDDVEARAAAENRKPTVLEIIDAMITPVVRLASGGTQWQHFIRLISRIPSEPQADELAPPESTMKLFVRFAEALNNAHPEPDLQRRFWRMAFVRAATQQTLVMLAAVQSGRIPKGMPLPEVATGTPLETIRRELIAFLAAGYVGAPPN